MSSSYSEKIGSNGAASAQVPAFLDLVLDYRGFEFERAARWTSHQVPNVLLACGLYVVVIFAIKYLMRNRKPFDLQLPLNVWNFLLALFSIVGTYKMSADFFGSINSSGFYGSVCRKTTFYDGENGYWAWVFTTSKVFEFGDTIFLVLRKKPLMFLHWYHHILTASYAFVSYPESPSFQRWGIWLNFFVHAFMYSYYFLRSMRVKVPGALSRMITTLQILQFVISCYFLSLIGIDGYVNGRECDCSWQMWGVAFFMDCTYLVLFVNFFRNAYLKKGKAAAKTE